MRRLLTRLAVWMFAVAIGATSVPAADEKDAKPDVKKKPAANESAEARQKKDDVNRAKADKEALIKQQEAARAQKLGGISGDKGFMLKMFEFPKAMQDTLTAEQKSRLESLKNEFGPRLESAAEGVQKILTPELRKGQAEAAAAAAEKFLSEKLTDAQKQDLKKAQTELDTLQREAREKIMGLIPAEQLAKLKGDAAPKQKKPDGAPDKKAVKPGEKTAAGEQPKKDFVKKSDAEAKKPQGDAPKKDFSKKPEGDAKKPAGDGPKKDFVKKPEGDAPKKDFIKKPDGDVKKPEADVKKPTAVEKKPDAPKKDNGDTKKLDAPKKE